MALAFMRPGIFNEAEPSSWPLFTTVETARSKFSKGTAIMVAIGGWGDTEGFSHAAKTDSGRKLFARNIKTMIEATGADGTFRDHNSHLQTAYSDQASTSTGNIPGQ